MSCKIDFAQMEWTNAAPGARFKSFEHRTGRVRLLEFTPEFAEADWCRKAHTGVVLEGSLEIDFGGRRERFDRGQALLIPAGDAGKHKAHALSERVLLFLVEEI